MDRQTRVQSHRFPLVSLVARGIIEKLVHLSFLLPLPTQHLKEMSTPAPSGSSLQSEQPELVLLFKDDSNQPLYSVPYELGVVNPLEEWTVFMQEHPQASYEEAKAAWLELAWRKNQASLETAADSSVAKEPNTQPVSICVSIIRRTVQTLLTNRVEPLMLACIPTGDGDSDPLIPASTVLQLRETLTEVLETVCGIGLADEEKKVFVEICRNQNFPPSSMDWQFSSRQRMMEGISYVTSLLVDFCTLAYLTRKSMFTQEDLSELNRMANVVEVRADQDLMIEEWRGALRALLTPALQPPRRLTAKRLIEFPNIVLKIPGLFAAFENLGNSGKTSTLPANASKRPHKDVFQGRRTLYDIPDLYGSFFSAATTSIRANTKDGEPFKFDDIPFGTLCTVGWDFNGKAHTESFRFLDSPTAAWYLLELEKDSRCGIAGCWLRLREFYPSLFWTLIINWVSTGDMVLPPLKENRKESQQKTWFEQYTSMSADEQAATDAAEVKAGIPNIIIDVNSKSSVLGLPRVSFVKPSTLFDLPHWWKMMERVWGSTLKRMNYEDDDEEVACSCFYTRIDHDDSKHVCLGDWDRWLKADYEKLDKASQPPKCPFDHTKSQRCLQEIRTLINQPVEEQEGGKMSLTKKSLCTIRQCSNPVCGKQQDQAAVDDGSAQEYQRCSRCRNVFYCSPECQKQHWKAGGPPRSDPTHHCHTRRAAVLPVRMCPMTTLGSWSSRLTTTMLSRMPSQSLLPLKMLFKHFDTSSVPMSSTC